MGSSADHQDDFEYKRASQIVFGSPIEQSKWEMKAGDSLVAQSVINAVRKQETKGLSKYGTTLETAGLNELELLKHQLEEAVDLVMYLQARILLKEGKLHESKNP